MSGLVEIARFYDSLAAGAAQSLLTENGIHSHLFDIGMTLQGVGFAVPVRLMADADDAERAERILAEAGK